MPHIPIDLTPYVRVKSIRRRFFSLVSFCDHSKSCQQCCWLWKGAVNKSGYGNFFVCNLSANPRRELKASASRFMYVLVYGHTSKFVLHICDNRLCANYNHMFSGSQKENVQDMLSKGRDNYKASSGQNNGMAKLTPDNVRYIFDLRTQGYTLKEIGSIVNVSKSNVSMVLKRKTWKHLQI